ncbi:MAG: 4'-phosphopantetheinyl transferase superfamily protein [Clostridia bacterium]|nr:4'-phosphopantetheinyl transferase superfamily protein [Clostridia bacterium]
MIRLCGVHLVQLPSRSKLSRCVNPDFYDVWRVNHRSVRDERAARVSLGGLLLLDYCDIKGILAYEANGRPYIKRSEIDFNITHTDQQIFCAVETPDGAFDTSLRVGLDAENLKRIQNIRICPMASRWFTEREFAEFQKDPTDLSFSRIWTRKEALVKWTGEGFRALRCADTTLAEQTLDIRFHEYRIGDTLVTLCCRACATPPKEIEMLPNSCLLEKGIRIT